MYFGVARGKIWVEQDWRVQASGTDKGREKGRATLEPGPWGSIAIAVGSTVTVAAVAWLAPAQWAATAVSACFFLLCYGLVLRKDEATIAAFGLRLAGVFDAAPLDPVAMLRETGRALGTALLTCAVFFPPFWFGYVWWWSPHNGFAATPGSGLLEETFGQLLVVALPEEMFYRGYLYSALERCWPAQRRIFGTPFGLSALVSSAIFALGHLATEPNPARLSVFFPALVFAWLRARTGGIGASVFFHALCNLFAAFLARSYGFQP